MPPIRRCCWVLLLLSACAGTPRRGATVLYASGADLQSMNPLFTLHPLARQVQRYVLLTTLVRYDSVMQVVPYLARSWTFSTDGRRLTLNIFSGLRWHDGAPTTARDAAWTFERARDPATGYPRQNDLAALQQVVAADDTTLMLTFSTAPGRVPDVLTDLAILPRHLLDTVPAGRLRQSAWQAHPVGNGPFRFVTHEAGRRWVFERNPDFPATLGGPPRLDRLVIAVVDEPMTKLAGLTSGELDVAGIQAAHAKFVERNPALRVADYPLLFTTGIVFNTRVAPFNLLAHRRRVSEALDRAAIVAGVAYGFGTPADGPVPPDVAGYVAAAHTAPAVSSARDGLTFELLTVGSGEAALEQQVQAQLARAGIRATIRQLELATFLDRVYGPAHDFTAAVVGTPGDPGLGYLQPLALLTGLVPPAGPVAQQQFFHDSVPVAFLYHARGLQGLNRRLQGVQFGLRGELATVHDWSIVP
ncbi:MAG: ABC transporter substrate-binding protein [Gemmatimonadota bacterium]|nr:ABC transporter substrate-binding protein [Gemmatimonadota bacterium]